MKKILTLIAVLSSLVLSHAQTYEANFGGIQEVPPNASPAFGVGTFTLSGSTLSVTSGTYQDLLGGASAISLNTGAPGNNGAFIFAFTLDTPGAASGTFSGSGNLTLAQVTDLDAGNLYVNIRSSVFPSGEIRGQIFPVPEPSTVALIGAGLLSLLAMRSRKV